MGDRGRLTDIGKLGERGEAKGKGKRGRKGRGRRRGNVEEEITETKIKR